MNNQQPAFAMGSGKDRVCASRDTTTRDATPGAMVSSPASGGQPGSPVAELFANTSAYVDTVLRPTPTGVESFEQISDSQAPQTFAWDVALHDGQQLWQLPNGDVAVVNGPDTLTPPDPTWTAPAGDDPATAQDFAVGPHPVSGSEPAWFASAMAPTLAQVPDVNAQLQAGDAHASSAADSTDGQALAVFSAAPALDATGRSVPTSLSVQGNQVVVTILHQGAGYTYPIVADPTASSASAAAGNGLGSQQTGTYASLGDSALGPGVSPLKPRFARRLIAWNYDTTKDGCAHDSDYDPNNCGDQHLGTWLKTVTARGLIPVLTIEEPEVKPPPPAPDLNTYKQAFVNLLHFTHDTVGVNVPIWGAWNEPEGPTNPLRNDPGPRGQDVNQAAAFWGIADRTCRSPYGRAEGCSRILAGEFSGISWNAPVVQRQPLKQSRYITDYEHAVTNHQTSHDPHNPTTWSVHGYADLIHVKQSPAAMPDNALLRPYTRSLKQYSRPVVWDSEVGLQLEYSGGNPTPLNNNPPLDHQAAKDYLMLRHRRGHQAFSSRIEAANYYTYLADAQPGPNWGLLKNTRFDGGMDPFCPFPPSGQDPSVRQQPAYKDLAGPPPANPCTPSSPRPQGVPFPSP